VKAALKSELYKIFSIRSTYVVIIFATLASLALSFIGEGLKYASGPLDADKYAGVALESTQLISLLLAVVAILHVTNEYRHNTISYTLTAINSRTRVFFSKIISISLFSVVFTLFITVAVVIGTYAGLVVANAPDLPSQNFPASILGRVVFYNLGLSLLALLISFLLRSIAGALVIILIGLNIIEGLLSIVLKSNADYLPMSSLMQVVGGPATGHGTPTLSPAEGSLVFSMYLILGGFVAWYLFVKRDAN
jgi:ABC-2 type transport system permease protein